MDLNRRRFTKTALTIGGVLGLSASVGTAGASDDEEYAETFYLDGYMSGWEGVEPSSIEGMTNPTLVLEEEGATYRVVWENGDGTGHNFAIFNFEGGEVQSTETISSGTQEVVFEATGDLDGGQYLCQPHAGPMNGDLMVGAPDPADLHFDAAGPPAEVERGEAVEIDVTVSNAGDETGTAVVEVSFGEESDEETVEVAGGDEVTATFEFHTDSLDGDVDWSASTDDKFESGTVTVVEPPNEDDDKGDDDDGDDDSGDDHDDHDHDHDDTDDDDDDTGGDTADDSSDDDDDGIPGFGVLAALAGVGAGAVVAARGLKTRREGEGEE